MANSTAIRYTILFVLEGFLFFGIGLPLALGRVRPNGVYGWRTPKTMSSETVWYAINSRTGWALCIAGGVIAAAAVVNYFIAKRNPTYPVAMASLGVMVAALVAVLVYGMLLLRRY
jgi:uncharacterized membrane protein